MKIHTHRHTKTVFLCVCFSVCPAAGCRWRGHQIHTRTYTQARNTPNRFSDNVISNSSPCSAVQENTRQRIHTKTKDLRFSLSYLSSLVLFRCIRPKPRLSMSGDGSFFFLSLSLSLSLYISFAFLFPTHDIKCTFLLCRGKRLLIHDILCNSTPRWPQRSEADRTRRQQRVFCLNEYCNLIPNSILCITNERTIRKHINLNAGSPEYTLTENNSEKSRENVCFFL